MAVSLDREVESVKVDFIFHIFSSQRAATRGNAWQRMSVLCGWEGTPAFCFRVFDVSIGWLYLTL